MSRFLFGLILIASLAGCQNQTATTLPTPTPLTVEITPALHWLKPMMAECAVEIPALALTVRSKAQTNQSLDDADILFQWSETASEQGYILKLGEELLAIVVHPENPVEEMDKAQLTAIYSGTITSWSELSDSGVGIIQPWVYPSSEDSQILFGSQVLANEEIVTTALLAPDPDTMLDAIREDPQAIGFIPARWLDSSAKSIPVIGYANSDLTAPILAVTGEEPGSLTREWLLCVQENMQP
ncbi:MAG: substrate-binding domain-containing protein [Bellilinea sp.]